MSYTVKEVYYTLQGEGAHTGRAAVFCRFAGCNLWSGREQDRAYLLHFIRDEMKFNGIDELKAQIQNDISQARRYFDEHSKDL